MTILGIDLGTTNSLACIYRNHQCTIIPNRMNELLTPSIVSIDEDGSIIVGKQAKERLITHPSQTAANFKRYMGTDKKIKLGKKTFSPEELSSFVLRALIDDAQEYLKEKIDEIVVSVPAYFNDDQRWATKLAGTLANVKIERIINEPSAAALRLHQESEEERTYIVVDFGGGTFDVSVVDAFDNIIEIVAVAGDNQLGGEDFNNAIVKECLKKLNLDEDKLSLQEKEILYKQAELCKRELNQKEEATIQLYIGNEKQDITITYEEFYTLSKPILRRMEMPVQRALKDAKSKIDEIDDIVLVGGSCKMRLVREYFQYLLNKEIKYEEDPDLAIAYGCGIAAGIKERNEDIKDVLLSDICPFTLGVDTVGGVFSPIIERNTILPCSREGIYQTSRLGQKTIDFGFYQGESIHVKDNIKLGKLSVEVPKNKEEHECCSIRFTYDINGLLEIDVEAMSTHEQWHQVIIGKSNRLSPSQITQKLAEMEVLKRHPRDEEKNRYIVARGERLFAEYLGMERQIVANRISEFIEALESQEPHRIQTEYDSLKAFLDEMEGTSDVQESEYLS